MEDCIELTKKNRDLELENDKLKSHLKEEVTSAEKQRNELKREVTYFYILFIILVLFSLTNIFFV